LTKEAANALLKTLEEPPSHAIFVLATTEIHKMIPTIISRCQRFDFRKLTVPEIVKKLEMICEKEEVKVEKPALELIALSASGSVRDGEGLLDQTLSFSGEKSKEIKVEDIKDLLGLVEIEVISKFTDFIYQKKAGEAIDFLNEITEKGSDLQQFSKSLINYLRQVLILKIVGLETKNPIITGFTKEDLENANVVLKTKDYIIITSVNITNQTCNKKLGSKSPMIVDSCGIIYEKSSIIRKVLSKFCNFINFKSS